MYDNRKIADHQTRRRIYIAAIVAFFSLAATFGSSVFSAPLRVVAEIYHVGTEVGTLATSLYVLGYAFGPIVWAPLVRLPPTVLDCLCPC